MSNPETDIVRNIREAVRKLGIPCERVHSGKVKVRRGWMQCASVGTPDLWTALGWLEVKVPGQQATNDQFEWHGRAHFWGVRTAVVDSVEKAVSTVLDWRSEYEHEKAMGWR